MYMQEFATIQGRAEQSRFQYYTKNYNAILFNIMLLIDCGTAPESPSC